MTQTPYTVQYEVPVSTLPPESPSSSPPHVFVGTALVNGAVVTAVVEIPLASPLTLEVTVTADNGQTATASRSVSVLHLLNAREGIVSDGTSA